MTASPALGEVAYYVDASRTSNGNGAQSTPWRNRADIDWNVVQSSLQSDDVVIYFSSRDTWNDNQELNILATGSSNFSLTLDGASRYNVVDSKAPVWQVETNSSQRAMLTNAGGTGGTIYIRENTSYLTIRGFNIVNPTWAGITHRDSDSATPYVENIHNILIENNIVESPVNNGGLYFVYLEAGCHSWTLRGNTVIDTLLEPIYLGHWNYLQDAMTNVVVEYNTIINGGLTGEGDIDLKPPVRGAIVRYNKHYRTHFSANGQLGAIVAANGEHQIYGNEFYNMKGKNPTGEGGHGIYISTAGDGSTGKNVNNVLIYNNLVYGNEGAALRLDASGGAISNLRILNNTFAYNGRSSIHAGGSGNIAITELRNNIFHNNLGISGSSELQLTSSSYTVVNADNNLFWNDAGAGFAQYRSSTPQDWSDWTQTLGFDQNGLNVPPVFVAGNTALKAHDQLTGASVQHLTPTSASPGVGGGANLGHIFTKDFHRSARSRWDIGAISASGGGGSTSQAPQPPTNVRVVSTPN